MTALQKSVFYWFCTNCRTDSRLSQRKILSDSSSQTSSMSFPPIYYNHSPAPHLFYIFTAHPTTQPIIPNHIPSPPNSTTVPTIPTIPTRLSPVTTKRLQSITSIANPPSFYNPHCSCIPPLLPPKSEKIALKIINNSPTLHLLTFLLVNYQLSLTQSLEPMKQVMTQLT